MNRVDFVTEAPLKHVKIFDGLFHWKNTMNKSICHLKVFTYGTTRIAIATELPTGENTGMSVTNGAEMLWLNVIKEHGDCECFETYDGQQFDHVEIIRGTASWSPCVGDMKAILRGLK